MLLILLILLATLVPGIAQTIVALSSVKQLAGTGAYFLVLQPNGQAFGVGDDKYGQLGVNTANARVSFPLPMWGVSDATDGSSGWRHSCIVDGARAKCSGSNFVAQLGNGGERDSAVMVPVALPEDDSRIARVFCGESHSFALAADGKRVWGWGVNRAGQLGNGLDEPAVRVPVLVALGDAAAAVVVDIAAGSLHSCFLSDTGRVHCAGNNAFGQIGTAAMEDIAFFKLPVAVSNLPAAGVISIACGDWHTCAAGADGSVYCWGNNYYGQALFSDTSITSVFLPTLVPGINHQAASVRAGLVNSFVLLKNGSAVAFGLDAYSQFGTGVRQQATTGLLHQFGQGVTGIADLRGGWFTTCVLLLQPVVDGGSAVQCTGADQYGQLGVGLLDDDDEGGAGGEEGEEEVPSSLVLVEMQALPDMTSTRMPTLRPTTSPTSSPTSSPSASSTSSPTTPPSASPTYAPLPTVLPTTSPTMSPQRQPTTRRPTTRFPTKFPTRRPTKRPTRFRRTLV